MIDKVAQGRVNIMQVQYFVTQGNLFGNRALPEEGDDAFQGRTGLPDVNYTVRVLARRGSFSLEGNWRR
jgi:hypothetical protein